MLSNMHSLLQEQVRDLYSAETQLVKALPKVAKAASTDSLRKAIEAHLEETRGHVERLKRIAELLEAKPGGKKCKGMEGLLAEGKEALEEEGPEPLVDAALIAAAQRVEHYEISAYGSARAMAELLGLDSVVTLLQQSLDEERAADEELSRISLKEVLPACEMAPDGSDAAPERPRPKNGAKKRA